MADMGTARPWDWNCPLGTVAEAVRFIELAGFDPAAYRDAHPDLRLALSGAGDALFHFLLHGCYEQRKVPITLDIPALAGFRQAMIGDQAYRTVVVTALSAAALRDDWGNCDEWLVRKWPDIRALQELGARPFVIAGSSAMDIYNLFSPRAHDWSLPLPARLSGSSAFGLNRPDSVPGRRFRGLVEQLDRLQGADTLPILCKVGGVEVDYLYHETRSRSGQWRFDAAHFDTYCAASVEAYLAFLCGLFPPSRRHVVDILSITPPAVLAEHWIASLMQIFSRGRVKPEQLPDLERRVRQLEMPTHRERTRLHADYNARLHDAASAHGFGYVEDFPLFLGNGGVVDPCFTPNGRGTDDHLERHVTARVVSPLLWERLDAFRAGSPA